MKWTVDKIANPAPKTVTPRTRLPRVLQKMVRTGVKSLPVVDTHGLVGGGGSRGRDERPSSGQRGRESRALDHASCGADALPRIWRMRVLDERLEFHGLGVEEVALLASLEPVLEEHADAFVEALLPSRCCPSSRRAASSAIPRSNGDLLGKQREYLLSLAHPHLRRAMGGPSVGASARCTSGLGLEPRWYLGAYALYLSLLTPIIFDSFGHESEKCVRCAWWPCRSS